MTIVEKIIQAVNDGGGVPCYYQSAEQLNRIADNMDYPCAYFFLLQQQGLNIDGGRIRERLQVAIFFVEPTEFDFDSIENEQIIERCKERAFKFIKHLMNSADFKLVSNNGTQRVYDEFDAILTGFAVNLTIEELVGLSVC